MPGPPASVAAAAAHMSKGASVGVAIEPMATAVVAASPAKAAA